MNKRFSTIFKIDLLASQVFCSKITSWAEKGVLPCLFQAEPFPVAILGQQKRNVVLPLATDPSPKNKTKKLGSGMHLIFVRLGVFHLYSEIPLEGNTSFLFLVLRGYCTPGPYFWRLCAFSQKIKQLRTKYPMDLVRNVPRNSKITVLLQ